MSKPWWVRAWHWINYGHDPEGRTRWQWFMDNTRGLR